MTSEEKINSIVNESRGHFSRQLENKLDLPDEKGIHEILNEVMDTDLDRFEFERVWFKYTFLGIKKAFEEFDDSKKYLFLYFLSFLLQSIVNKRRFKSFDLACWRRFNKTENSVRQLDDDSLKEVWSFIKSERDSGEYSQMTDSFRDVLNSYENYKNKFGNPNQSNLTEEKIRELKRILGDCIKYLDSSIHIIDVLASAVRGYEIEKKSASKMSLNNKTKSLKDTPLEFILNTYNSTIRNSMKHGSSEIKPVQQKYVFKSRNDTIKLTYEEFTEYVIYFIGTTFCVHCLTFIVTSEYLSRVYEDELYASEFNCRETVLEKVE